MADEGFEEWDADFLEKVIQVEELAIAATQRKSAPPPVLPPQPQLQPPVRFGYAHEGFQTSYSPPRELSQREMKTETVTTVVEREKWRSVREAAVAPVARSSRSGRGGSGSESEISRLKRELERVSKQLTQREQECLELRKERDKKEVQLQSATLPKEARTSHAPGLRTTHFDLIVPSPECTEVSARCLDINASTDQGSSRFGSSSYHTKGVQTDAEFDDLPLTSDKETSCNSLSKKLKAIRCSSADLYSGKYLVSKLLVVCVTELQVLFGYCRSPISSKHKESINDKNLTHVTSVDDDMLICSSDSAKVSRFYSIVTKMSNGMVQFETFYKALLDLCNLQNCTLLRDNCAIESANNAAALSGTESIRIGYHKHHDGGSPYVSDTSPSCIEWLSLFQLMHQISTSVTDEPILYETVSIMNLILKRDGPLERERYGHITVFQTVPKLLKKDVGLRVQKEAVDLLYLVVNCPTVLSSLYSGFKEDMPNSNGDSDVSPFEGLYNIFAGLEDCLTCSGTGLEAIGLRRNAITLLSYLVSFGSSGYEVLWSSTTHNKISFLVLILRLLASEIDAEHSNPSELTDTVKERTLLVRESLIFLNRIVSHPAFSGPALRALTGSREVANLTVDITSRLSRRGESIWPDDSVTKQMLEIEISNLARVFCKRISAYLGDNISL
uniref:Uncharacterized protein n=1 Tax=Kalanchoe fedtschenkoi TaxID=63787 RepID=A0A7N0UYS2_KALFE